MEDEIEMHTAPPAGFCYKNDKSFIIVLERMLKQAQEAARRSEPCVESQHEDGVKIGKLYMIQDVIKAFKEYE